MMHTHKSFNFNKTGKALEPRPEGAGHDKVGQSFSGASRGPLPPVAARFVPDCWGLARSRQRAGRVMKNHAARCRSKPAGTVIHGDSR